MTCTIVTTEAADAAGRLRPRMPLALTGDHYDAWLDPAHQEADELRALLGQPADGHLKRTPRLHGQQRPAKQRPSPP